MRKPPATAGPQRLKSAFYKYRSPESELSARRLVEQAFKEFEEAERIKELRALGKLPPAKEHHHHG